MTFLDIKSKNASTKPFEGDYRRRASLTLVSLSHETRIQCGFLKFHLRTYDIFASINCHFLV